MLVVAADVERRDDVRMLDDREEPGLPGDDPDRLVRELMRDLDHDLTRALATPVQADEEVVAPAVVEPPINDVLPPRTRPMSEWLSTLSPKRGSSTGPG